MRSGCLAQRGMEGPAASGESERAHTAHTSSPQSAACQCWPADALPMHRTATAARQRFRMKQGDFNGNRFIAQRKE